MTKPKSKTKRPEDLTAFMRREVADRIRLQRTRSGKTTAEIAEECGVGVGQIFRILAGTNETTWAGLARLADCFGIQVGDLFPRTSDVIMKRRQLGEK